MTRWAACVALLVWGISFAGYVAAEEAIAVPSANLDRYLATLEERATQRRFLLSFGDLLFSAGSVQIGDREKGELVRMADFLRTHPQTVAQIVGYADDRGVDTANSRLAEQRAAAVRAYLVSQRIDPSRLTAASAEGNPLPGGRTQSSRANNRRVEILVQKSQDDDPAAVRD